jgi:hypothetical protein
VQPLLQWKSDKCYKSWECVCSLRYPACNKRVPYCRLWPAPFFNIFLNYLTNAPFSKKVTERKICVSSFSTTFVWNIFHSKKNWARYDRKCMLVHMESNLYSCPILMKLWIFLIDFRKILKYKIPWKSVQWEQNCCMRTDVRTDRPELIANLRMRLKYVYVYNNVIEELRPQLYRSGSLEARTEILL